MSSGEGGQQISAFLSEGGLSGRRLEACLEVCGANWIETIDDLRRIASNTVEFDKTFPQSVLRVVITEALANADLETTHVTEPSPNTSKTINVPALTAKQPAVDDTKAALPEGKR